jgi:hypothetical protein
MTELSDTEQSLKAIETCFALIANAPFPVSKHDEVRASLTFLDALHTQLKGDSAEAVEVHADV